MKSKILTYGIHSVLTNHDKLVIMQISCRHYAIMCHLASLKHLNGMLFKSLHVLIHIWANIQINYIKILAYIQNWVTDVLKYWILVLQPKTWLYTIFESGYFHIQSYIFDRNFHLKIKKYIHNKNVLKIHELSSLAKELIFWIVFCISNSRCKQCYIFCK